jgi:2'-5' RNA ligase
MAEMVLKDKFIECHERKSASKQTSIDVSTHRTAALKRIKFSAESEACTTERSNLLEETIAADISLVHTAQLDGRAPCTLPARHPQALALAAAQPYRRTSATPMDARPDQMSLLGLDAAPALFEPEVIRGRPGQLLGYSLFFAILPPPELAQRVDLLGAELRRQHGLQGRCLRAQHRHVSLHAVAGFKHAIPMQTIDAARAAAAGIACPPLPIVFDRAHSFSNRNHPDANAFVLRCDARSDAAVARLRQALALALRRSGLDPAPSSTPHMTMLYDQQVIPEHPVEPICWTATRFALILSHQGLGHHEWLGHWELT